MVSAVTRLGMPFGVTHDPHEVGGAQRRSRRLFLTASRFCFCFQSRGPDPLRGGGRAPTHPEIKNARPGHGTRRIPVSLNTQVSWPPTHMATTSNSTRDGLTPRSRTTSTHDTCRVHRCVACGVSWLVGRCRFALMASAAKSHPPPLGPPPEMTSWVAPPLCGAHVGSTVHRRAGLGRVPCHHVCRRPRRIRVGVRAAGRVRAWREERGGSLAPGLGPGGGRAGKAYDHFMTEESHKPRETLTPRRTPRQAAHSNSR